MQAAFCPRHGNVEKSKNELGFEAKMSLPEGLQKTVEWTKQHLETIKRCMKAHERYMPEIKTYFNI